MSVDRPRTTRLVSYPKCRELEIQAVLQSYHPHLEQYTKNESTTLEKKFHPYYNRKPKKVFASLRHSPGFKVH